MTYDELATLLAGIGNTVAHSNDSPVSYTFHVEVNGHDVREVVVALHEAKQIVFVHAEIRPWLDDNSLAIHALRSNADTLAASVALMDDMLVVHFRRALAHVGGDELLAAIREVALVAHRFSTDAIFDAGSAVNRAINDGAKQN